MTEQQEKQILADVRKLKRMLRYVPKDRKPIGEKLVEEIAFMSRTLLNLREEITENGVVDHFKQGKQEFMRESPALKAYNTTVQRYSLLYKQFTDLLPKPEPPAKEDDELMDYLKKQG